MKIKKQPEVRFDNYTDEWKMQALKHVANRVTRKNKELKTQLPLTISAQYGLVDQVTYFNKQVASKDMSNYYLLERGEFAYNKSYSRDYPWGAIKRLDNYDMGALSSLYITFKPVKINSDFLLSYYDTNKWHKEVSTRATEGARNHGLLNISANDFLETELAIPLEEEQEKVGSFFKQLDEAISLYQQELDTLKQTKQGFLQKMFPKEGESVPELRFPGFTEDWKASNLIDMTTLITKGTTPKDKYSKGNVNFIKVENIEAYSGAISVTSKVSQEEHEGYLKRSQLKCGDILFSIAGTLGRTTVIKEEVLPANTNQALAIIRLANGNIDFIETYLKGKAVKDYIRKNPTVGAQPNLSLQQVGELSISYPSDLEQKKIGEFFKNLDRTIALQQQELDALKQTKKAFLQKMFV